MRGRESGDSPVPGRRSSGHSTLRGRTGTSYAFGRYERNTEFEDLPAVYALARRTEADGMVSRKLLYVGETERLANCLASAETVAWADRHGCNCIYVFWEEDPDRRSRIVADLRSDAP